MRVVVLTDDHPPAPGGVATWTGAVVRGLAAAGHDVRVYARARSELEEAPGAALDGVRGPSFGRWGGAWLGWRALPDLARADRVLATTWPVATLAARLDLDLAVVAHGSDVTRPALSGRDFRRVWSQARRRFAVSRFLAERVPGGARVLPAPVDAEPRPASPRGEGVWAMVGRAVATKGGDRFVRLVARAGVTGIVVGDGPELGRWRALARELGARIRFVGAVDHDRVRGLLRSVDLVALLPRPLPDGSGAEGLGLAAIEAAAAGVPVVGCATGGLPEALGPGLVLPDPDDADDAARRVREWWSSTRGAEAWAWCRERHGVGRAVDALLSGS